MIHLFVSMLLYATLLFVEASVGDTPISVVAIALVVVLVFLPILEVRTYDTMLQHVRLDRTGLRGIPQSLFVHSGFWVLAILLLERAIQLSSIGLLCTRSWEPRCSSIFFEPTCSTMYKMLSIRQWVVGGATTRLTGRAKRVP
ncbi:hypothetical protein BRC72_07050 [Halobacteriales archaeon QH_7_66_36]|nr:MAG: hypothetical protein BRC72_07050 [Halobacteriales archaeon QH_7_66_36]